MAIAEHVEAIRAATHDYQLALSAADLTQAAAKAADIERHRRAYASALANGVSPSVSLQALRALGAEPVEPLPPPVEPPPEPPADQPAP
jgi:hypothetical protein